MLVKYKYLVSYKISLFLPVISFQLYLSYQFVDLSTYGLFQLPVITTTSLNVIWHVLEEHQTTFKLQRTVVKLACAWMSFNINGASSYLQSKQQAESLTNIMITKFLSETIIKAKNRPNYLMIWHIELSITIQFKIERKMHIYNFKHYAMIYSV